MSTIYFILGIAGWAAVAIVLPTYFWLSAQADPTKEPPADTRGFDVNH